MRTRATCLISAHSTWNTRRFRERVRALCARALMDIRLTRSRISHEQSRRQHCSRSDSAPPHVSLRRGYIPDFARALTEAPKREECRHADAKMTKKTRSGANRPGLYVLSKQGSTHISAQVDYLDF